MSENTRLIAAISLCVAILFGYEHLFPSKVVKEAQQQTKVAPVDQVPVTTTLDREEALKLDGGRVIIDSATLHGSVNLKGARFDDLTLANYHVTPDTKSPEISLLSPTQATNPYYAQFGWIAADPTVSVPTEETVWQVTGNSKLTPETPVTLTWNNGQGLVFEQTISLDKNYMFGVTQKVVNTTARPIALAPKGEIKRAGKIETADFFILHEGPIGVFAGTLSDPAYKDVVKASKLPNAPSIGWLGFTDKYWLTAMVPDQSQKIESAFEGSETGGLPSYKAVYKRDTLIAQPGQSIETKDHFFAGAKILNMLDQYEVDLGIEHFDLAVDFGWFYFLTKPIFYVLSWLQNLLGNFGLAILALTVVFKVLMFPLANKSYHSMARMKTVQPKVKHIQETYADDRLKMNEKMLELYKKEKINPASGCLPMLVQIPVFFALYKVLFVSIEMRHAPFYGWIHDLSAADPTTIFNLFGLLPFTPPSFLMLGVWPILMGLTMFLQQKLSPPPGDPMQAKMMMFLPLVFTFMMASFPAGLVIYWTWSNLLSLLQQSYIMRHDLAERRKAKSS